MQCHQVRKNIPDLIDQTLPESNAAAVQQHLNMCPDCRAEYRVFQQDAVAISSYAQQAPWPRVTNQVMGQIESQRSRFWDQVLAGGNKLAAGIGVAAVLLIVLATAFALREMAGTQDQPGQQDTMIGAESNRDGEAEIGPVPGMVLEEGNVEQIVDRLDEHGLVYEVGASFGTEAVTVDGGSNYEYEIDVHRIAFDRHLTLVEYRVEASDAVVIHLHAQADQGGGGSEAINIGAGQSHHGWVALPGPSPDSTNVTVSSSIESTGDAGEQSHDVDVDLSALRDLPMAQAYEANAYSNGIELCCLTVERGIAASLLTFDYNIRDEDELVDFAANDHDDAPEGVDEDVGARSPYPVVTVDGEPVAVLPHFFGLSSTSAQQMTFGVFDLPDSGELEIEYDYLSVAHEGEDPGELEPAGYQGPWSLTTTLEEPVATPDESPEPTVPADVAGDSDSGTAEPEPAAEDEADDTLDVLIYLARGEEVGVASREIEHTQQVATAAMEELLRGPTEEEAGYGLRSAIPEGTELLDIALNGETVTVLLSEEFNAGAGNGTGTLRAAQVVHTLTQFDTISHVDLRIGQQPIANTGGGFPTLTRDDFEDFAPAILVESPAPGEVITGEVELHGTANVFEASFMIEITDASGEVIYESNAMATSGTGTRGTFDETIPLDLNAEGPGTITLWAPSARDGSRTNVVEVPVEFAEE